MIGFYALNAFVHFSFIDNMANPAGIAVIHSVFNIFATAILLPFHRGLEKLAILTVRTSDEDEKQSVQPAEEGQDIVCAAVSVLVINTVNSLETFTDDQFEVQEDDGYVSFHFTAPVTERGTLLMDSLILGLTEIEHSYNNRYLTVKVKEV